MTGAPPGVIDNWLQQLAARGRGAGGRGGLRRAPGRPRAARAHEHAAGSRGASSLETCDGRACVPPWRVRAPGARWTERPGVAI